MLQLIRILSDDIHEIKERAAKVTMTMNNLRKNPDSCENANEILLPKSDSLCRLSRLISQIEELEKEVKDQTQFGYYRMIAELLEDVHKTIQFFDPFVAIPKIIELTRRLLAVETEVKRQVQWALREVGQLVEGSEEIEPVTGEPSPAIEALTDVSLVVDALGPECRVDLLERFSQLQLIPYERKFQPGKQFSDIYNLQHRWNWFNRLIKAAETKLGDVFPFSWRLSYHLYLEFCRRSKLHLRLQLTSLEAKGLGQTEYVEVVLTALKNVLTFVQEVKTQLGLFDVPPVDEEQMLKESLGDAFDPFLDPYVKIERSKLDELIQSLLLQEEQSKSQDDSKPEIPFESSRQMFEYIKKSYKRCSAFSNGNTLLSLSMEFRICLQQYCESLDSRLPIALDPDAYNKEGRLEPYQKRLDGKPPTYHVPSDMYITLCRIIKTGEYCAEVVPQLETIMKQQIRPSLADDVEFSRQIDSYMDLCTKTVHVLVIGVIKRLEEPFKSMRRINWGTIQVLGDQSSYTFLLSEELQKLIPDYRRILSTLYFRSFCSKLAVEVLEKFLGYILRQKKITQVGAEQLMVDCDALLPMCQHISLMGLSPTDPKPPILQAHLNVVTVKVNYIEAILKLLRLDDSILDESFKLLWPDGKPSDLQLLKEIRGGRDVSLLQGTKMEADRAMKKMTGVVNKVGEVTGAKVVTGGLASGMKSMGSGMKSAMGGLLSGDLFGDREKSSAVKKTQK